jgi:hypothetical protein
VLGEQLFRLVLEKIHGSLLCVGLYVSELGFPLPACGNCIDTAGRFRRRYPRMWQISPQALQ